MVFYIDAILFAEALEDVASDPDLVAGFVCTLAEHLEFPLALCHFGIDAFVVDACVEADVEVLFNDLHERSRQQKSSLRHSSNHLVELGSLPEASRVRGRLGGGSILAQDRPRGLCIFGNGRARSWMGVECHLGS